MFRLTLVWLRIAITGCLSSTAGPRLDTRPSLVTIVVQIDVQENKCNTKQPSEESAVVLVRQKSCGDQFACASTTDPCQYLLPAFVRTVTAIVWDASKHSSGKSRPKQPRRSANINSSPTPTSPVLGPPISPALKRGKKSRSSRRKSQRLRRR